MLNNTGMEANSAHRIGTVSCHSASNQSNIGRWISPSGEEIPSVGNDMFQIQFYTETFHSYTTLVLRDGMAYLKLLLVPGNAGGKQSLTLTFLKLGPTIYYSKKHPQKWWGILEDTRGQ